MYLAKLSIEGFRKLKDVTLEFRPGLNVLVGPNNVGKTAVMDALRVLLNASNDGVVRLDEFDLHVDAAGQRSSVITFRYVFRGLTVDQEADFLQALVPVSIGGTEYEAHFSVRYDEVDAAGRLRPRRWCGEHEDNAVPADLLDALSSVYLPPLRDPASGLRPHRSSQLAKLAVRLAADDDKAGLVDALKAFDQEVTAQTPVSKTQHAIVARHQEMLGPTLSQALSLGLTPPDFGRLVARLALSVEHFDVEQNGLGFNNLIFMAVVLSELSTDSTAPYKALIVEEPEAHLHPQLQAVLLDYLQSQEASVSTDASVQVFVTSHSPHFASLAQIDSLACVYDAGNSVQAFLPRTVLFEKTKKEKLQRYLDVTRAALFFAPRIVLVEGAAELFIVDALAKRLHLDLRKKAVSILSTDGLNFDAFLPLFADDRLRVRVAVLTDADPGSVYPVLGATPLPSAAAHSIQAQSNSCIAPFIALKTLEYDLALHDINRPVMLDALSELHPQIAATLSADVAHAPVADQPRVLFSGMFERGPGKANVQKGAFGQALAHILTSTDVPFAIPAYLQSALTYIVTD